MNDQKNLTAMSGTRHPSLPQHLNAYELAQWLQNNAVQKFTHEVKRFFSADEIKDFEHESSVNGREMNKLNDILKEVRELVTKGNEKAVKFTIPETIGTKQLEAVRRENDDFIETGYATEETEVFGIPNQENHMLEFFDVEGNYISERSRPLSAKEKHEYLGFFANLKNGVDQQTGEVIDDEKASRMYIPENFDKTGTDGQ